jgi:hypothetical protein
MEDKRNASLIKAGRNTSTLKGRICGTIEGKEDASRWKIIHSYSEEHIEAFNTD